MKLHKESLSQRRGKWGYGEIGRRYGLDCIEPWYGNLPIKYIGTHAVIYLVETPKHL